ncbi:hypothetical protein J6590_017429 [Homalodisca vitripennis]|nr:hypothetical protein J6590_017429 [Homalodisca vitripennis]
MTVTRNKVLSQRFLSWIYLAVRFRVSTERANDGREFVDLVRRQKEQKFQLYK